MNPRSGDRFSAKILFERKDGANPIELNRIRPLTVDVGVRIDRGVGSAFGGGPHRVPNISHWFVSGRRRRGSRARPRVADDRTSTASLAARALGMRQDQAVARHPRPRRALSAAASRSEASWSPDPGADRRDGFPGARPPAVEDRDGEPDIRLQARRHPRRRKPSACARRDEL